MSLSAREFLFVPLFRCRTLLYDLMLTRGWEERIPISISFEEQYRLARDTLCIQADWISMLGADAQKHSDFECLMDD